jgi:hypothetical protein
VAEPKSAALPLGDAPTPDQLITKKNSWLRLKKRKISVSWLSTQQSGSQNGIPLKKKTAPSKKIYFI